MAVSLQMIRRGLLTLSALLLDTSGRRDRSILFVRQSACVVEREQLGRKAVLRSDVTINVPERAGSRSVQDHAVERSVIAGKINITGKGKAGTWTHSMETSKSLKFQGTNITDDVAMLVRV
jgi:hypothetical protein